MDRRWLIVLLIVAGLTVLVGPMVRQALFPPAPEQRVSVVVAARDLRAWQKLDLDDVALLASEVPASQAAGLARSAEDIVGMRPTRRYEQGEYFRLDELVDETTFKGWTEERGIGAITAGPEDAVRIGARHWIIASKTANPRQGEPARQVWVTLDAIAVALQTDEARDLAAATESVDGDLLGLPGTGESWGRTLFALTPADLWWVNWYEHAEEWRFRVYIAPEAAAFVPTPLPTGTPLPTETPVATYTPLPTHTPYPTQVPETATPQPTARITGGKALAICEACRISWHPYDRANVNAPTWLKDWVAENPDQYLAGIGRAETEAGDTLFDKVDYGQWATVCAAGTINTLENPEATTLAELEATGRCYSARIVDTGSPNLYVNIEDVLFAEFYPLSRGVWSGDVYLFGVGEK